MSKKILCLTAALTAAGGMMAGVFAANHVMAAAPSGELKPIPPLTDYEKTVTTYEKEGQAGGCGAPEKVLLDNEVTRVNLVSFPKDFVRCGQVKRRNHQLLVYIDPGDFTLTQSGASGKVNKIDPNAKRTPLPPGSIAFHARDSVVSTSHINNPYRVVFVEMKK